MPGHSDIVYGSRYSQPSPHSPVLEWRPIHVEINRRLRHVYGFTMSQANSTVVAYRVQIMDEQDDGHDAEQIAHMMFRLLRSRGEV